jgi:toxin FitB
MFLLDTNVVSEPMLPSPNDRVVAWLDSQAIETFHIAAVTIAEMRFGIAILPDGKRRDLLSTRLEGEILPLFAGRILPFDLSASQAYAELMAKARTAGLGIGTADGYIAAIARSRGLAVVSRDTAPFAAAGLEVINPWVAGQ